MPGKNDGLDGAELELTCACGHENFERVVVERRPGNPIVTDFVACVGCRAMYFVPLEHRSAIEKFDYEKAYGDRPSRGKNSV